MITTSYPRWNEDYAGIFIHRLSQSLVEHGHEVRVLAPHYGNLELKSTMDSVDIHRFSYLPSSLELMYGSWYVHEQTDNGLRRLFHKSRIAISLPPFLLKGGSLARKLSRSSDVLISHWVLPSGLIGEFASTKSCIPNIVKVYGGDLWVAGRNPLTRLLTRNVLNSADQVVSNSSVTGSVAQELCGREVIPIFEGVNPNQFDPSVDGTVIRDKYGIGESPLILSLGRFVPYKGFEYLVGAVKILKKHFPRLKAIIGGTGPLWGKIKGLVDSLKLGDCVFLPGFISNEDLPYYYSSCDVYVASSVIDERGNSEGLNVTLLEAMSTSKPVVASKVGGIIDVVNERTGFLVSQKNCLELSEAIARLLLDDKSAKSIGKEGRRRVLQHFTLDKVAERMIEVCEKVKRT